MAPKRNQKTQLSMLHFAKRNAVAPSTQPTVKQQVHKPQRRTPRPTAPPFFKQPMPKPTARRHATTVADDAWEVADRLIRGQRLTPRKRPFEDAAPVLEDSDDDFEPDIVTPNSRARPASVRKSSANDLRDDRASMTKRSANKSKRPQSLGYVPTQQRSVFEDFGLPPKMSSLASSEEDDDDNHVVVFDGEKSSLSGTDNEDERGVDEIDLDADHVEQRPSKKNKGNPSACQRGNDSQLGPESEDERSADDADIDAIICKHIRREKDIRPTSNSQSDDPSSKIVVPPETSQPRQNDSKLPGPQRQSKPSKETSSFLEECNACPHSSGSLEPRTIGCRKCSTVSEDLFEARLAEESQRRRRKIRPLFNSDCDESDSEKFTCREQRRRGRFKSPSPPSSLDDTLENGAPNIPSARATIRSATADSELDETEGSRSREGSKDSESSDVEIVSTPKQRGQTAQRGNDSSKRRRCRSNAPIDTGSEGEDELGNGYETPVRTPKNKKSERCETDARTKTISEYIATASPSLSPPSKVKRRRRFRRLIAAESSEDEDDAVGTGQCSKFQNGLGKRRQNSAGAAPELSSGTPKSAEWFHERDIDEFSESSCDTRPSPRRSYVTRAVTRRKRKIARASLGERQPLPVKRIISKSFDRSPDQSKPRETPRTCPRTPRGDSDLHAMDSVELDRAETTRNVQTEVIDLVDEDEEPEGASNDGDDCPEIRSSLSSGRGDKIDSPAFEDDAPPPFNLIALCKDGESIHEMKERLGEEFVMDKVTEAQENGREILGGEELGLTGAYNKSVFDRFSKTVVADQLGKKRAAKSVTEKALRGEYKFHYRGRQKDSTANKGRGSSGRGNKSWGRFANSRRRRGSS